MIDYINSINYRLGQLIINYNNELSAYVIEIFTCYNIYGILHVIIYI